MIKLVSRFNEEPIIDPNYIKIAASIKAYGTLKPFCTVWQTGSTLICKIDSHVTIYGDDFDADELKNFLSAIGMSGISCSLGAAEKLGFPYQKVNVLVCKKGVSAATVDFSPSCDRVYELLNMGTDGDIILPDRMAFIADLSHRIRHETALAATYKGTVCVAPYIIKSGALICGVCAGENRGGGFTGLCVSALVNRLARPTFVLCSDELLPFYKKYMFEKVGENAEIEF